MTNRIRIPCVLMVANPFGRAAFRAGEESRRTVEKGGTFRLSFGILIHSHATADGTDLAAADRDYLGVTSDARRH